MAPAPNRRAPGLLLVWAVLDAAMGVYLGLNGPSTISRVLLAAGVALLLFVLLRRPSATQQLTYRAVEVGFAALLVLELVAHVFVPYRPEAPRPTIPVAELAAMALTALGVWVGTTVAASRLARFAAVGAVAVVIATALLARFAIIAFDVEPGFDVHVIQDVGGRAILEGQNPYLTHAYHSGYPYWPLASVVAALGLLAGDARWGLLIADAVTAVAFVAIARNVGAPGRVGALAAALLLWNSSGLYMTWQSLPESVLIAFAAIATAVLTRPGARGWVAGIALGLMVATKQLGLGLLPLLPLSREPGRRSAFFVAGLVAAAIILPFMALDPAAFVNGSISSHMVEPSRDYAVNLLDPLPGVLPQLNVPLVITGILALGAGLAVRLRWPDSIDGWLAGSAALLTVAFAFIGISFVNYFQIPIALLLALTIIPDGWGATRSSAGLRGP